VKKEKFRGYKKNMGKYGMQEALRKGQEEAKNIWEIEVPFILDNALSNEHDIIRGRRLAKYLWYNDANVIFNEEIETLCEKYNVNFHSALCYCICHETGHAKEERLFEKFGFFPFKTKNSTLNPQLRRRGVYDTLSNAICDFSINRELFNHDIINSLGKPMYFDVIGLQEFTEKHNDKSELNLVNLLSLPHILDIYEHGRLDDADKKAVKDSQKSMASYWDKTLSSLKTICFDDPESKINVINELLKSLLDIDAVLMLEKSSNLFQSYSNIPAFWNKKEYFIMTLY
jgi:hypothetical protein